MIVIPYFYETARAVYGLERPVKIGANMYGTAKKLILVYLLLTLVGFLSFMATGLTTFDAITHVMTAIATGGMSTYDEGYSVIYRASPNSAFPFMTIMIPGAFNFVVLYELVTGNVREVIRSEEFKYFTATLIILSLLSGAAFYILEGRGFVEGVFPVPWEGVKFDETGQNIRARGIIVQVMPDTGKYHTVWPPEYATRNYIFPMPEWSKR